MDEPLHPEPMPRKTRQDRTEPGAIYVADTFPSSFEHTDLFDALPTPVAVLDCHGVVLFANRAWRNFRSSHPLQPTDFTVGRNYLQSCDIASGEGAEDARKTAAGIRRVLAGELNQFEIEYACPNTREQRYFRLTATPMRRDRQRNAVVMHINVTEHRRTEILMEEFSNVGQKLSAATTPKQAAQIILEIADRIWGWDCSYLHLYSAETNKIHPILTYDIIEGKRREVQSAITTVSSPSPRAAQIIKEGAQLILRDPRNMNAEGLLPFGDKTRLSASIMVAPVRNGKKVTGVLSVDSYTFNAYTIDDLHTLQSLADHCGGALERIWAQEALRESETRLRALASRLQAVREEESIRIAREIHDELGQAMTGMKMDLLWLQKRVENITGQFSPAPFNEKINAMVQVTDQTIKTVRRISSELRPGILDDLGLLPAIDWHAREFQNRTGVKCDVALPQQPVTIDQPRATAVFRIFQEILTNIARHAKATRATITVKKNGGSLLLEIRDDGVGISEKELAGTKSLGLVGMRERALLFGGQLSIQRGNPAGTVVRAKIPLLGDAAVHNGDQ